MLPAATLIEDRDNEIMALERELRVLEGDEGDDEEEDPSPLDSSQTMSLTASQSKQMAAESTAITQNEMNEIK